MTKLFSTIALLSLSFFYGQSTEKGLKSISETKARAYIEFLASDALKGRDAGSPEGQIVAEYLASKLKEMGIKPLENSYFQDFEAVQSTKKPAQWQSIPNKVNEVKQSDVPFQSLKLRNVLGYIPGKLENEFVIVGAHYDHLGENPKILGDGIYNGADDNASGVSAVLQIAQAMLHDGNQPMRSVIFAFWDGEEKGLLGSLNFTEVFPKIKQVKSYLNFDMIGRNNNEENPNGVVFFYTAKHSAFEQWLKNDIKKHKLNLIPDYRAWENPVGGSDNGAFARKNIPILWYHTDGHKDYHQPTDSAEKINWKKLVEITKAAYLNTWKMANEKEY